MNEQTKTDPAAAAAPEDWTLEKISGLCKVLSVEKEKLRKLIDKIHEARKKATSRSIPVLQRRSARVSAAKDVLAAAVEESRHLFQQPKSRAFHGIKVGLRKQPGRIVIADEEATIKLIRRQLPQMVKSLLVLKVSVDKEALGKLSVKDLKKIGATVEADTNAVFVRGVPSDIDKFVDALLQETEEKADATSCSGCRSAPSRPRARRGGS